MNVITKRSPEVRKMLEAGLKSLHILYGCLECINAILGRNELHWVLMQSAISRQGGGNMPTEPRITQYSLALKNKPGQLHGVLKILAKERINLLGIAAEAVGDVGYIRFITEKSAGAIARKLLEGQGNQVLETSGFRISLANRPGELARLTETLEKQGINIEVLYGTANSGENCRLILIAAPEDKAEKLLSAYSQELAAASR